MNTQVQNILNQRGTKTDKIKSLLDLGFTRTQIADLAVLGKYGAIQNVYAKWQLGRTNNPTQFIFTPSVFNRRFGIEIEAYGCNKERVATELRAAGIACHTEGYNHDTRNHWKIITDGSLSGDNTFEIVSPVLEGESGLEQVKTVSRVLVNLRVKINKTCGLHVHFDAASMNLTTWKNLILNYAALEPIIDTMMPQSRRGNQNTYCKSLKITNLTSKIENASNINQLTNIYGERYYKINTKAYARHRTVEFRQHSGTIESEKITNWILFLHNLVDYSQQHKLENPNFDSLKLFNQESVTNFYHNRIQDLSA
jgi:hypothetical protein